MLEGDSTDAARPSDPNDLKAFCVADITYSAYLAPA